MYYVGTEGDGWLKQCAIRTIALQSTGVYWIAVYDDALKILNGRVT